MTSGSYTPVLEVCQIRHKTGLSQSQFAKSLGNLVNTLKSCEQGQHKPSSAAATLMQLISKYPNLMGELA